MANKLSLLVDLGNSRLKWAWAENWQIVTGPPLDNEHLNPATLRNLWQALPKPDFLIVSCVSAWHFEESLHQVAKALWPTINIISVTPQAHAFGVTNAYPQPEKLGVDRWLSLIAARKVYDGAVCVVDCGTAITIDLLDAEGCHQGGFIAPGLTLMKKSLVQGTHALQFNEHTQAVGPANNTDAAIYSGTLAACRGLIEHVLSAQSQHYSLILTGGDAALIADHLAVPSILDHDLVLRGLLTVSEGIG